MQLKSTECCLIVFYSLIDQEGSLTQNNNYVVETFEAFEKKKCRYVIFFLLKNVHFLIKMFRKC